MISSRRLLIGNFCLPYQRIFFKIPLLVIISVNNKEFYSRLSLKIQLDNSLKFQQRNHSLKSSNFLSSKCHRIFSFNEFDRKSFKKETPNESLFYANAALILAIFVSISIQNVSADELKSKEANPAKSAEDCTIKVSSISKDKQSSSDDCTIQGPETKKKRKKKVGFSERRIIEYENRLRAYSSPDKIFRYFATLKLVTDDGASDVFMTPEDFVRSLTPGVMQPRRYGLDKFRTCNYAEYMAKSEARNKARLFHWIEERGLINFGDYLFLMTVLATSPSEFRMAFLVYDVNSDGELDRDEFLKVQELILSQSNVGHRHRDHVTGVGSFRAKNSAISHHFFGEDGKQKLSIETFLNFQRNLHQDILKIEFVRRDPESGPLGIISEIQFAELLTIHANLHDKRQKRMMKRVRKRYKTMANKKGVSFDEVNDFFMFLNDIEKVDMALHFYKLASTPLTKELLQKVARRVSGVDLSDTVVDVVVTLFDDNGDGKLSHQEFVSIMKRRMQRGLEKPKETGLARFLSACLSCGKKQVESIIGGNKSDT